MDSSGTEPMTPDQVTAATFGRRFRGVDSKKVAKHLDLVADALRALRAENTSLRAESDRLAGELSDRPDAASTFLDLELDDAALNERVGEEAGRVLSDARSTAADRLGDAEAQAAEIRADAETMFAERSRAADLEVARIRAEGVDLLASTRADAEAEGEQIRGQAEADAGATRSRAASEKQDADAQAAHVLAEADLVRRQILEDLARRRSSARRQIEQLRAGRERLLASHDVVRRALDEIKDELTISMSEARAAAETAGFMVSDTTIEELEAEIETARITGLLDTGPVPIVETGEPPPDDAPAIYDAATAEPNAPAALEIPDIPETPHISEVPDVDAVDAAVHPLAEVVSLDRGRAEVDTGKHPAASRERTKPSTVESNALPKPEALVEADSSVEDLFARMRSSRDAEPASESEAPTSKPPTEASSAGTADPEDVVPDIEPLADVAANFDSISAKLARRLKRVLADEQSEVMSTLSAATTAPTAAELLGTLNDHQERYWVEVEPAVVSAYRVGSGGKGKPGRTIRVESDEMVEGLRRRIEACLEDGGAELDDIVEALRNLYREVKTQRLSEHADSLCRNAAALGSDRS